MIPKVFISYSWSTSEHTDWVINLAQRLLTDGVDVVIDKWELREGHDLNNFMETMVKSEDINRVLIILDKTYAEKADKRSGGVGTETQIISPNIYADVSQEKFIPLVTEKDDADKPYLPIYLKGRVYLDFSSEEHFESNYENLLRNLFNRPSLSKPKLGKPPSYLFEETPMTFKTSSIVRSFDSHITKNPNRINSIIRDFFEDFYTDLKGFKLPVERRDNLQIGKAICENINQYTPLRNDFILFLDKLTKSELIFDIEIIFRFFEKLPLLKAPLEEGVGSWSNWDFDNYRFIIHELFLYLIAMCLKNERYDLVEEFLYTRYFIKERGRIHNDPEPFEEFASRIDSINPYYNQTYGKNFLNPTADFMIKRLPENISKTMFVHADLICHYVARLNDLYWFPITYIYERDSKMDFFDKLISKRHFEKIKVVLNVDSVEELQKKLLDLKNNNKDRFQYPHSFDRVTPIYDLIKSDRIATVR